MKLFSLTTSESANSTPAAAWQSCFSTVMNLPQGTSSCLPLDQSEQPAQVSSARRTRRGSSAWFTSSRWVERLGEEVSRTPGTPWQQPCQRPPRWSVDEMTTFLSSLPEGKETERVLGDGGYRWHVSLYFGVCYVGPCEGVWRHLHALRHLHSIRSLYWNELKRGWRRGAKYSIKAYLLSTPWGKVQQSQERKEVGKQPPWWMIEK